jgi:hypothetical protein
VVTLRLLFLEFVKAFNDESFTQVSKALTFDIPNFSIQSLTRFPLNLISVYSEDGANFHHVHRPKMVLMLPSHPQVN